MNNLGNDDNAEQRPNLDDYQPGLAEEYFPPLQQIKSANRQNYYRVPEGWNQKFLKQYMDEDSSEQTSQESTHSFSALIILIVFLVLGCCILPCCYYTLYDPEARKHLRNMYNDAKRKFKSKFGFDDPSSLKSSNRYRPLFDENGERRTQRDHHNKNKNNRKCRSKRGRIVQIPIPSDESVDICITTTEQDSDENEFNPCEELDLVRTVDVNKSRGRETHKNKRTPCPFEPTYHANRHPTECQQNHYQHPHRPFESERGHRIDQYNINDTNDSDPDSDSTDMYSRYEDATGHIHHNLDNSDLQQSDDLELHRDNHNNHVINVHDEETSDGGTFSDKFKNFTNYGLGMINEQKSKLVKQWNYKTKLEETESLGPQPPARKSKKNSI